MYQGTWWNYQDSALPDLPLVAADVWYEIGTEGAIK